MPARPSTRHAVDASFVEVYFDERRAFMPAATIRPRMTPRRSALAATTALLAGLALAVGACTSGTATLAPTLGPTTAPATLVPTAAPSLAPTAAAPSPTPTPVTGGGATPCDPASLGASITSWEGAAGNRIATVQLINNGRSNCSIPVLPVPQLVDANNTVLIQGAPSTSSSTMTLAYYDVVKTLVSAANYCGAAPTGPVTVAFVFPSGEGSVVATPAPGDPLAGVPPCNGPAGSAGQIDMQPFAP
jgi:hypothetical protein